MSFSYFDLVYLIVGCALTVACFAAVVVYARRDNVQRYTRTGVLVTLMFLTIAFIAAGAYAIYLAHDHIHDPVRVIKVSQQK